MKHRPTSDDVRKSPSHTLLDTLLSLLLIVSYVPQIHIVLTSESTAGITQSYFLLTYLFHTTQFTLVSIYTCFGRLLVIREEGARGRAIYYSAITGFMHAFVLWAGSACLYGSGRELSLLANAFI